MISPIVATAIPLSSAAGKPCSSAMVGPQAIAVPCPPTSETDPTITPAAFGMPSATAPIVPITSCRNTKATVTRQRTPRTRPPAARSASRAFTPTVAKKMTSSLSRVVMSKSMSTPRMACTPQKARAAMKPPVTGSGML